MADRTDPALPEGYAARPPVWEDLDAVVTVTRADEIATRGEADTTYEDLLGDWRRPGFDRTTQAVVVEREGTVVAYAEMTAARGWVFVHPDHHGRGLGGALLDWTVARGRAEGLAQVGQTVSDDNPGAVALVQSRGFHVRWETWLFSRPVQQDEPVLAPPPGYEVRPLEKAADVEGVHDAIQTAFSGWPDRDPPLPFEDWRASFYDRDDIGPEHSFVAVHDGRIVGALLGLIDAGDGLVEQLGVHPDHQGRRLGEALMRHAFDSFATAGIPTVHLVTESRTGARDFYERLGFVQGRSFRRWTKPLG